MSDGTTVTATAELIEVATHCLVAGLDSPTLRVLAGLDPELRNDEIRPILDSALSELAIPTPNSIEPWRQLASGGQTYSRQPTDTIRFEIQPADGSVGGHEVLVHVNDTEMTSMGAGMGMDPFEILIPTNRLVAMAEPTRTPIARCDCGVYGCGSTDVTIVRVGDVVHWEWHIEVPMGHGVTFPADLYDAEVARIAADHSWERPEDTTARTILEAINHAALAEHGLKVSWAARHHENHDLFGIALWYGSGEYPNDVGYQIFLRVPWQNRSAQQVAEDVAGIFALPPEKWPVTFHSTKPGITTPPPMAGGRWKREVL
ncbi:hypothetical protein ASE01_04750 [Nocardioides sp. Root190]|nr:hypothetical protein ASE01_04750 [Nocardioides sp. Root190]